MESLKDKYEQEVARLVALKVTLDVEEGRLKFLPPLGLLVGLAVGALTKPAYGLLPIALSLVMVGTGLYLTRVHKMERDYNLGRARKELARLVAEERAGAARTAEAPAVEAGVSSPDEGRAGSDV